MGWVNALFRNPLTLWMSWFFLKAILEYRNRDRLFKLGYLARASCLKVGYRCRLGSGAIAAHVALGDYSYAGDGSKLINAQIGKFVSIANDVIIGLGSHPSKNFVSTHPIFFSPSASDDASPLAMNSFSEFADVRIGNDVWIGARVIVKDGITIGDGAIVGAGAVVTRDVAPYSVVGGVPARLIRMRFSPEQVAFLQELRWWDRDMDWLEENAGMFDDIRKLMAEHASIISESKDDEG